VSKLETGNSEVLTTDFCSADMDIARHTYTSLSCNDRMPGRHVAVLPASELAHLPSTEPDSDLLAFTQAPSAGERKSGVWDLG